MLGELLRNVDVAQHWMRLHLQIAARVGPGHEEAARCNTKLCCLFVDILEIYLKYSYHDLHLAVQVASPGKVWHSPVHQVWVFGLKMRNFKIPSLGILS